MSTVAEKMAYLLDTKTAIKDAIVAKGVEVPEETTFREYADKIQEIQSSVKVVEKDVNFFDYDGTLLYSYTISEANELTEFPKPPEHPGLLFQDWNWSFEKIKNTNFPIDIGAVYITEDGATKIKIGLNPNDLSFKLAFYQPVANSALIEWGDSSGIETSDTTGAVLLSHTYPQSGEYIISVTVQGQTSITFGGSDAGLPVHGKRNNDIKIKEFNLGSNCNFLEATFSGAFNLNKVTLCQGSSEICASAFVGCCNLKNIVLPNTVNKISESAFEDCYSLHNVLLPDEISSIGRYAFIKCVSLNSIVISGTISEIGNAVFMNCYSIYKIVISENVQTIYEENFENYFSTVILLSDTPPIISDYTFMDYYLFYVPKGASDAYKSAEVWSKYAANIFELE